MNDHQRERFEALVDRSGEHHLWLGAVNPTRGTGRLKVNRRQITAHRHAWELANGPLADGARVLACVAEPACVRLDHLRLDEAADGDAARPRSRSRKGSGTITQVRDGVWKLTVTTRQGTEGRTTRVHRTIQASTAAEATEELAAFVTEIRDAGSVNEDAKSTSVDDAVERYLVEHLVGEKGREDKTVRDYRALHRKWFSPHIGALLVRDVDAAAIDRVFGRMRRAGLSKSRMNQAKCLYRPFFRWALKRQLTRRDPMSAFELPRSTHVSHERVPPEVEELILLLDAAVALTPDVAPLLALGAVTGMRRGELVGLRRSRIRWKDQRITVDASVDGRRMKGTKTGDDRTFYVDEATITLLRAVCDRQDELAAAVGSISPDPFLFSLAADASLPMPPDYVTKRVATLKSHLGIEEKRPATAELEDEALRLFREPRQPRPAGMTGPTPAGAHSYAEIGRRLNRSERWAAMAIAAAERREAAVMRGGNLDFDGSILALRKFTSSELLDAGFNISMVAQRQGHGTQVLAKHYSKSRRSSDRRAAEHLGAVVHGNPGPSAA